MQKIFWICLFSIVCGLLVRIPIGGAGILLSDILLPIFAALYCIQKVLIERSFPRVSFFGPGMFFLLFAFLSFFFGAWDLFFQERLLSFFYLIRFFSILVFGVATMDFLQTKNKEKQKIQRELFFRNLLFVASTVVLLGYLQFYLFPDIGDYSTVGGFDPHTGRLLGTWMDPNFLAGFLGFLLPVMFGKFYNSVSRLEKIKLGILILIFLYALFLTFSRSGYLSLIVGMTFFFLFRDLKIILLGVVVAGFGLFTSERAQLRTIELVGTVKSIILQDTDEIDPTASLRIESWSKSFELWKKYPLLGIGYNTYRFRAAKEGLVDEDFFSAGGSDSTFLTILVTTGIFGFVVFAYFYAVLWITNLRRFLQTKNELYLGFVAGLSTMFVHSIFVNSFLFPHIFLVILFVAGILEIPVLKKGISDK